MKRRSFWIASALWAVSLAALLALNGISPRVEARQPATEEAAPPAQTGNADLWTLGEPAFETQYPDGFTFRLSAESSAGEIERARVLWYRPVLRPGATRQIEAETASLDPETGELVASWQPDSFIMLPPWSVLQYQWELRDSAGNELVTEPETAEYADEDTPWVRSESEDAIVYASDLPNDADEMILDAMAAQRDKYEAVWGAALPYRPRIVLFGDYDAWLEWRTADNNPSDSSVVVGQTFDAWGVIAQVVFGTGGEADYRELAYSTVVHEIEHLYQAEFLAGRRRADTPGWFYEGDATFFELEQSYDYLGHVQTLAREGSLPPLLVAPADAPSTGGENPRLGYDIGYSFFAWMEDTTGGLEAHHEVMTLLSADVPFFEALEQALGMPKDEIESRWRVWLGASSAAPTLVPTWTPPAFLVPPTPMQFGD